ncbi:MAG: hypothetical protein ACTSRZ_13920 [Promethearchaeota archaeon]
MKEMVATHTVLFDDSELWKNMLSFRYKGMLTLKNLDNDLPTESWDSMYHTSIFLAIAALRFKRIMDIKILDYINETLKVVLEQGINFRGFNSEGEYWKDYMYRKYYALWHDKDVFRDTSRDQVLALTFGIYFVFSKLKEVKESIIEQFQNNFDKNNKNNEKIDEKFIFKIDETLQLVRDVAKMSADTLISCNYNLRTTYGDCQTFEIPLSLVYQKILQYFDNDIKILRPARKSVRFFKIIPRIIPFVLLKKQYFTYDLIVWCIFLLNQCFDANYGIYPQKLKKITLKGFKKFLKMRLKDKNLFWELLYYLNANEFVAKRNSLFELNEIFKPFLKQDKKIQDFIWQRHPKFRYRPRESWKNFYAPYHDYLIVYELICELNL